MRTFRSGDASSTSGFAVGSARVWAAVLALALGTLPGTSWCLPPGRAWAPTEAMHYPGADHVGVAMLHVDEAGTPMLVSATWWDSLGGCCGTSSVPWSLFTWSDSVWTNPAVAPHLGTSSFELAVSLTSRRDVAWFIEDPIHGGGHMVMAELHGREIGPPDTVMVGSGAANEIGAATSATRRWVVRNQQRPQPQTTSAVRVSFSDTVGIWHALPELGVHEDCSTIAPLGDRSAIVVSACGYTGLAWWIVEGSQWTQQGVLDSRPYVTLHPRFRLRPSGGLWLAWSLRGSGIGVTSYQNGWSTIDTITAVHGPGELFVAAWIDVSRDDAERPVIAWGDFGFNVYRDIGSTAFPTDSGWAPGEEIPGSDNVYLTPHVTVDRNGDAWYAWNRLREEGAFYTHTYVSATASRPELNPRGRDPVLSWELSEPAPKSRWTVLRSRHDGEFESIATLTAGRDRRMSYADPRSPRGRAVRYKVRRESVDARYRWESEEARSKPQSRGCVAELIGKNPVAGAIDLSVSGAQAGDVSIRIYDLQGRLVHETHTSVGGENDVVRIDLARSGAAVRTGVYFVLVRDAADQVSPPVKIVVVR